MNVTERAPRQQADESQTITRILRLMARLSVEGRQYCAARLANQHPAEFPPSDRRKESE